MSAKLSKLAKGIGLRARLLIGVSLIVALGYGLVYYAQRVELDRLTQVLSQQSIETAEKNLRASLGNFKENQAITLQGLAREGSLRNFLASSEEARLKELLGLKARSLGLTRLWLLDPDLKVRYPEGQRTWPSLERQIKASLGGDVSTHLLMNSQNQVSFIAAVPILDESSRVLAYLAAERHFDATVIARMVDQSSQVSLVRRNASGQVDTLATNATSSTAVISAEALDNKANPSALKTFPLKDISEAKIYLLVQAGTAQQNTVGGQSELVLIGSLVASLIFCGLLIHFLTQAVKRKINEAIQIARRTTDGDFSEVKAQGSSLPEVSGLVQTLAVMRDGLKQRERGITRIAYRDPVTGLPNQNALQDKLKEVIAKRSSNSAPMYVMVLVVDHIRDVNDSFGPHVADQLLTQVAERFRALLREVDSLMGPERRTARRDSDVMLARLSGAQFAVFIAKGEAEKIRSLGLRLIHCLDGNFEHEGQSFSLTARCGIASFPNQANSPSGLITAAGSACIEAHKELNRLSFFNSESDRKRDQQLALLNELRRAVTNRQLHLNFQPKIDLSGQGKLMAEAFLRWDHPERGPQNPAQFVPFAEKTGFITELTHWVLEASINQIAQWAKEGLQVQVAVNVTVRDLSDIEFSSRVVQMIRSAKIPPNSLTIEIPEDCLFSSQAQISESVLILSRFGIRVAVDNFAKGFAIAHRLQELSCAYVKMSRSFISRIESDRSARIMVRAAVELAHGANIRVVAEGVERSETLGLLRKLGCDEAQGYAISRPLGIEEYRAWIRHQSERYHTKNNAQSIQANDAVLIS